MERTHAMKRKRANGQYQHPRLVGTRRQELSTFAFNVICRMAEEWKRPA